MLLKRKNYEFLVFNVIFILFYFIINYLQIFNIILLKFFFSKNYYNYQTTDLHISNSVHFFKVGHLLDTIIMLKSYNVTNTGGQLYNFISVLEINALCLYSIMVLFLIYKIFNFIKGLLLIQLNVFKSSKLLFHLEVSFILSIYRNYFNTITIMAILQYIIFLINFFALMIKDFIHVTIYLNFMNVYFLFLNININFNSIKNLYKKKQLTYIIL